LKKNLLEQKNAKKEWRKKKTKKKKTTPEKTRTRQEGGKNQSNGTVLEAVRGGGGPIPEKVRRIRND